MEGAVREAHRLAVVNEVDPDSVLEVVHEAILQEVADAADPDSGPRARREVLQLHPRRADSAVDAVAVNRL